MNSQNNYTLEHLRYTTYYNKNKTKHPITNERIFISLEFGDYTPDGSLLGLVTTTYRSVKELYYLELYISEEGVITYQYWNLNSLERSELFDLLILDTKKIKLNNQLTLYRIK